MKYCPSARSLALISLMLSGAGLAQVSPQAKFYPVTPCRVADTRNPNGAAGGPALGAGTARAFLIASTCGIPVTARAAVTNITVTGATAAGDLAIFPTGTPSPQGATAITFRAGKTRANNFIARLGTTGDIAVFTEMPSGSVHLIIDVAGYFEDPPASPISTYVATANLTTFGATPQLVAHIRDVGRQRLAERAVRRASDALSGDALQPNTIPGTCTGTCQRDNYTMYPLQRQFFTNALYAPDQLRQRVAWALHKFLVISGTTRNPATHVPYLNTLVANAFGNYRDILFDLTLNPAMGDYLNMRTSTLQNPNENYAREIMQLFSIGLVQLNVDGTPKLDGGGNTIPTYTQYDINEFSRVFTGWQLSGQPVPGTRRLPHPDGAARGDANHDKGKKIVFCDWTDPTNPINCRRVPREPDGDRRHRTGDQRDHGEPEHRAVRVPPAHPEPRDVQPEPGVRRAGRGGVQQQRLGRQGRPQGRGPRDRDGPRRDRGRRRTRPSAGCATRRNSRSRCSGARRARRTGPASPTASSRRRCEPGPERLTTRTRSSATTPTTTTSREARRSSGRVRHPVCAHRSSPGQPREHARLLEHPDGSEQSSRNGARSERDPIVRRERGPHGRRAEPAPLSRSPVRRARRLQSSRPSTRTPRATPRMRAQQATYLVATSSQFQVER